MKPFPHYIQFDAMDCGPTCLRMIAKYYGKSYTLQTLRQRSFITREGVSMLGISDAAETVGFHTSGVRISFKQLVEDMPLPCILHWNQNHFVVCYRIKKKGRNDYAISIADPAARKSVFTKAEFLKCWISTKVQGEDTGTALILQPGPEFYEEKDEKNKEKSIKGLRFFARYLRPYKSQLWQLVVGMMVGSALQLIFPFLTQAMVDTGIGTSNLNFITLILIAQLVLFTTQLGVNFIRSWIVLHMNSRINITLISDFLAKLMKLPMSFFDTKMVGDIMQRIGDHGRIQGFLTGTSLSVIFSFVNFIIFGIILAYYNPLILLVFAIGNTFYVLWILSCMKFRRELDHRRFAQASSEQSTVVQLVTGMQEIKLSNCEKQKRWQWERIQVKLFKISVRGLALGQYQELGSVFFNQATGILISFIAAKAVVDGDMTLGMMMSQSYIIGQLSAPIGQFIGFAQSLQDAKISLERLNEIHNKEDEEQTVDSKLTVLPEDKTFNVENLYFSYDGADRDYVLEDVSVKIPHNKITAIVGASGSGKTTLVKLLLAYYNPNRGNVNLGEVPIRNINPHLWRKVTGAVMQEGFIFSDTIAGNIAPGEEYRKTDVCSESRQYPGLY
jgi:ATP-binding cassette subfamily B protein